MSESASIKQKNSARALDGLAARLAPDMAQVDALIFKNLESQSDLTEKIARHLISSGGKRLRPMIVLAAAHLGDAQGAYRGSDHILMAGAVELMHTATLLHDDVVDESAQRRGQPAARILWGNAASILVGDFLLGRAFALMVTAGKISALKILSQAASTIAEGEVMQLAINKIEQMNESDIMAIIAAKTASLFAAAAETGGLLSGCGGEKCAALKDYGHNLGMAFQLMDDALDYDGASEKFGKKTGGDFREGKITLPVILCWHHAGSAERQFWRAAITAPEKSRPSDFKKACKLMQQHGALAATRDYAMDYAQKARAALKIFPDNLWRRDFEDIADFSINRNF